MFYKLIHTRIRYIFLFVFIILLCVIIKVFYIEVISYNKLKSLSDDEKVALLNSNGMLIKRPLLVLPEKNIVLLGFKADEWQKI